MDRSRLLAFAIGIPSLAATTVTPGPWDLYSGSSLVQSGFSTEQACVEGATQRNITQTYTCRTRTTVYVTEGSAPAPAPPPAPAPTGQTYSTNFALTENPMSEGGAWVKASNVWQDLQTIGGAVIAKNYVTEGLYDDAYRYLGGFPSNNYSVVAEIYYPTKSALGGEVEILLRVTDGPNFIKCYEFLFNTGAGSWQLVRWNGPMKDITVIHPGGTLPTASQTAQIRADIVGSNIKLYWRASSSNSWTLLNGSGGTNDGTHATGKPGIGIYVHAEDGNRMNVGLKSYTVTAL